jgi:hypothetical protein
MAIIGVFGDCRNFVVFSGIPCAIKQKKKKKP